MPTTYVGSSLEKRQKISNFQKVFQNTSEVKMKKSLRANSEKNIEHCKKMAEARKGKPRTEEEKLKISLGNKRTKGGIR